MREYDRRICRGDPRCAGCSFAGAPVLLATFLTTAARTSGTLNQQRDRAGDA